jgi:predicted phage terminase large subunit-like protein
MDLLNNRVQPPPTEQPGPAAGTPFDDWLARVSPELRWDPPHLVHIRKQLERVTRGELRHLIISCPPRHGKSEQGSVRYPAWRLAREPSTRVIVAAYSASLACRFSRKIRRLAPGNFELSPDRKAVDDWETTAGGGVRAVGVGGGVTGRGADLILIDDPVKSRAEAESQAYRRRIWDWFRDDLYTRQEPGCAIVLTQTRWHELDLAGQILQSEFGADWEVINLPALAEPDDPLGRAEGEALWPERFDRAALLRRRALLGRSFCALYQGKPAPAEGNQFKRPWFRYWSRGVRPTESPEVYRLHGQSEQVVRAKDCRRFGTVDLAVSTSTSADYTVIAAWALTPQGDLLLLDLVRDRFEVPEILRQAGVVQRRYDLDYLTVESNGMQLGIVQTMRRPPHSLTVRGIVNDRDKISRATAAIVRLEAGMIYFPERAPWLADYETELLGFPTAAHDDQVDVTSLAAIEASRHIPAPESAPEREREEEDDDEVERLRAWHSIDNPYWWSGIQRIDKKINKPRNTRKKRQRKKSPPAAHRPAVRSHSAFVPFVSYSILPSVSSFVCFVVHLWFISLRAASNGLIPGSGSVLSCTSASWRPTKNVRLPATSRLNRGATGPALTDTTREAPATVRKRSPEVSSRAIAQPLPTRQKRW